MTDLPLFIAGLVIFLICGGATVGAVREVLRQRQDEQRVAVEVQRMAARRQAFLASQLPPQPRRPLDLPIGPGAEAHAAVRQLRVAPEADRRAA